MLSTMLLFSWWIEFLKLTDDANHFAIMWVILELISAIAISVVQISRQTQNIFARIQNHMLAII